MHAAEIHSVRRMIWLRDFPWRYFTLTGDIDAYLLYKQHEQLALTDYEESLVEDDEWALYPD
jgi:hypothetical protein